MNIIEDSINNFIMWNDIIVDLGINKIYVIRKSNNYRTIQQLKFNLVDMCYNDKY